MDVPRLRAFGPGPGPGYDPQAAVPRTAARVEQGRIQHFRSHLNRLTRSAEALDQPVPWLIGEWEAIVDWVASATLESSEMLRLRLHGDRVWALLEPLPETPLPYRLRVWPHPLGTPLKHPLAPHKGLTGAWGVELLSRVEGHAEDALLFWPDGTLVETAIASIAFEIEGELWLPPIEGRVASLAEHLDLPGWAGPRGIRTQAFRESDLHRGRLWCFNAVRGFWPGTLVWPKMRL